MVLQIKSLRRNALYGYEYAAACICTDHIVDLHNNLCCLGVPLHTVNGSDDYFMFGDSFLVVNLTIMPAGKLQFQSHIHNYQRTQESQAKGIIKFVHMNGNEKPANIVTNSRAYNTWSPLMIPLLFWRDMDFFKEWVVAEGSENSSSTTPLSQATGTPQKLFKLDLWHILGE